MTSTKTDEPWFVAEKRVSKAARFASQMWAIGYTAADAVRLTLEERAMIAANMGEKTAPSDLTWRIVVNMLAGSLTEPALCPTCGVGDPLGEPGPRKPFQHPGGCSR